MQNFIRLLWLNSEELETFGRITMQRFRPTEYAMKAYP